MKDYPTPETDANCEVWPFAVPNVQLGDGRPISGNVVNADFARDLERRIAECRDFVKGVMETSSSSRLRRTARQVLTNTAPKI